MAPLVRTGGSRHTGQAALPHHNIHPEKRIRVRNGKKILAYGAEKSIRLQQQEENVNFAAISADENIICFTRQHHDHQHNVRIAERSLKW